MTEQLLQFIWRFQYFNPGGLATVDGQSIEVVSPGLLNRDQGPDFSHAAVVIAGIRVAGEVELHLRTGDWLKHRHGNDPNYDRVILHVVWEHDQRVNRIPVLELHGRVPRRLLGRYAQLMVNQRLVPCNGNISQLGQLGWTGWKDRLLFERVERKCNRVRDYHRVEQGLDGEPDWWLLARSFGNRVNALAFEALARSVPLRVIARNRYSRMRLEAILLGQAGLLPDPPPDIYQAMLLAEYRIQRNRFGLQPPGLPFLLHRMRPGNFPQLRLAQLAALVFAVPDLRSLARETGSLKEMEKKLRVELSPYWQGQTRFRTTDPKTPSRIGKWLAGNIVINAIVPLLFLLADQEQDNGFAEKAVAWLQQLRRESNAVTDPLQQLGFSQDNAFDSQAVLELKTRYCDHRKCLECAVGYSLLNPRQR